MAYLIDGDIIGYVRRLHPLQIRNLPSEDKPENLLITEHEIHPDSAALIIGEPVFFEWVDRNSGKIKKEKT